MVRIKYQGRLRPFSLRSRAGRPWRRAVVRAVGGAVEQMLGLSDLNRIYADIDGPSEKDFLHRALDGLRVSYQVNEEDLARIPRSGPVLFVSNHPFGGLDGLILAAMARRVRPDAKVMANFLLARVPELRDAMIFVDPFGGKEAARRNVAALRESLEHVSRGGALAVFPAGAVSHVHWRERAVMDPAWSQTVARIVRRTGATVVPVYFHGGNSPWFQLMGMVHPKLRTAMLPRELLNKARRTVQVEIGTPIEAARMKQYESDAELTDFLRLRTYILKARRRAGAREAGPGRAQGSQAEIAPAEEGAALAREVQALGAQTVMGESAEYVVHAARAEAIPHILREIGRLREVTFREVHEGTGRPLDLDEFDRDYLHLFCWSKTKQEIVGAYRLGPTDEILPRHGVKGLYTRTLFRYEQRLMDQLGPAIELGRSFVRREYQRSYSPLLMLWRGIAQYIARNPRYQVLFGPVSINSHYQSMSRRLIISFLEHTCGDDLSRLIHAYHPPRNRSLKDGKLKAYSTVVRDIDEVSDLVQEIETDHKGVPVLLRQYMKLSARVLGFNVDPDFANALDGLILVDFRHMEPKVVERFCGKQGAQAIFDYQRQQAAGAVS